MSPWLLVTITSLAVVLGAVSPVSSFELMIGSRSSANSSSGGSSLSFDAGASFYAQAGGGSETSGDGTSTGLAASGNSSASVAASLIASADFEERMQAVIRLINDSNWSETSFAGVTSLEGGTAFDIGGWFTAATAAEFDAALEANWGEIQILHAAIEANSAFSAWLEGLGMDTGSVVTVGQTADGSLAVFTSGS